MIIFIILTTKYLTTLIQERNQVLIQERNQEPQTPSFIRNLSEAASISISLDKAKLLDEENMEMLLEKYTELFELNDKYYEENLFVDSKKTDEIDFKKICIENKKTDTEEKLALIQTYLEKVVQRNELFEERDLEDLLWMVKDKPRK